MCLKAEDGCLSSERERERTFTLPLPFCFILAFSGLDMVTHIREMLLVSLSMQMLIFSGNTLIDTTGNNGLLAAMWASLSSVKMAHKN